MRAKEAIMLVLLLMKSAKCEVKEASKSKNPLPYFRRQVEGLLEESTVEPSTDDFSNNLVNFFVKNAKEIFDDVSDESEDTELSDSFTTTAAIKFKPTHTKLLFTEDSTSTSTTKTPSMINKARYKNLSLTTLLDLDLDQIGPPVNTNAIEQTIENELMHLTKELKSHEKADSNAIKADSSVTLTSISSYVLDTTEQIGAREPKRVCIFCDNILSQTCNEPQNKLIPSVTCEHDGDLCYSQHTPFGVIDRGCFNVNQNLTTYVCSCNLCNYISISEMPYIFSNKQDWVDNVIEHSRTRSFRKSVFKDMSCLRCEVNTTTKTGDMFNSANCLEGNIGNLPIQDCEVNEICAVKALRSEGYIWRGCIRAPLYNYWWALCDTDLCNYDTLISLYDLIT